MKKILAFLLVATMLCALFVIPSAADDKVNFKIDIPYVKTAPKIDGVVKKNEYGKSLPLHTYSESKSQFSDKEHNDFDDGAVDVDFHMAWDKNNLYVAWVVKSETFGGLPEKDFTGDGVFDSGDYGYMWMYSCVQFIMTPGVPEAGKTTFQGEGYGGNYLEAGLCLTDANKQCRVAWSKPTGAELLEVNDWDAVIVRDDAKKTTTYEVRIPWSKSGLKEAGNDAQFGFTYAVGFQENYEAKKGMIEWQDGVLSTKQADNAAVVTLTGNKEIAISTISSEAPKDPVLVDGELPASVTDDTVKLAIDAVNTVITAESAVVFTAPDKMQNTKWTHSLLLKPLGNDKYTVVESKQGDGSTDEIKFDADLEDGMIVASFHSDSTDGAAGKARKEAAAAIPVGTELTLFGISVADAKQTYKNSMLYVSAEAGEEPGEASGDDSSADESSEAVSSEAESSAVEESKTSSVAESSTSDNDGGSLVWLWIVLAVVAVAVVAAVVVVVLKKKKAQ